MADNHQYPGIDLPLRQLPESRDYYIGAHCNPLCESSYLTQVREVAMMALMDLLTDKPNWHQKIFDDEIVSRWRQEAMTQPEGGLYPGPVPADRTRIISEKAFNNCIAELRDKAAFFKQSGLIYTLNSSTRTFIIKADALMNPDLHRGLKDAFDKLLADQASNPNWQPGTREMVQDIVHPSMYPFVYNRSPFIHQEVVGVSDAIDKWSGKGQVPTQNLNAPTKIWRHQCLGIDADPLPADSWSEKYQWLPSTLAFQEDGTVKFTSYINNLHPEKYPDIYQTIEKLIDTSIPAWDHALSGSVTLKDHRLWERTYTKKPFTSGCRFNQPPRYLERTYEGDVWESYNPKVLAEVELTRDLEPDGRKLESYLEDKHSFWYTTRRPGDEETIAKWRADALLHLKWKQIRDPVLREPVDFQSAEYVLYEGGPSIRDKFKNTGLQVYVKMASIELTPEKPDFPASGWQIEGQMNEHIVATARYYVDSENVTPSWLSFRIQASDSDDLEYQTGACMHDYYEALFGVKSLQTDKRLQQYGSVETQQGRLLAFPNTFQHQVSSFSLKDKTKPGHRKFIALCLVNPEMRAISTANVPPQQFDWWFEAIVGATVGSKGQGVKGKIPLEVMQLVLDHRATGTGETNGLAAELLTQLTASSTQRLPLELLEMIQQEAREVLDGLMTAEEANQHRLAFMKERSLFHVKSEEEWRPFRYCRD